MIEAKEFTVGQRIRYYRQRRGLSQAALAGQVGRSEVWLGKVERGEIPVDRLSMLLDLGRVLHVRDLSDLVGPAVTLDPGGGSPGHPSVPAIRRALSSLPSLLSAGYQTAPPEPAEVATRVAEAWRTYETEKKRYEPVGEALPGLLAEAHAAVRNAPAGQELVAVRALIDLYHLHQMWLRRVGEHDWSRIAADRALALADETGDPALIAAAVWNVCCILTTSGDVADSLDLARSAIERCRPVEESPAEHVSAYGALHLAGVIAAVRSDNAPAAWDLLREADRVADRLGEDRNDWHAVFGPTNVKMHAVHLAAEEGDATEALRLADDVSLNESLPLERRTRYMIEVMNSNRMTRDDYGTLFMLQKIKQQSPEEIKFFPLAREATTDLLKRERPAYRHELREVAEHMGVLA